MAGLETTLQSPVKETKAASVDILLFIVDYSPSLVRLRSPLLSPVTTVVVQPGLMQVREYMMQQINSTDDDGLLMNIVIEGMICDTGGVLIDLWVGN